jgi:hypothetical protein
MGLIVALVVKHVNKYAQPITPASTVTTECLQLCPASSDGSLHLSCPRTLLIVLLQPSRCWCNFALPNFSRSIAIATR